MGLAKSFDSIVIEEAVLRNGFRFGLLESALEEILDGDMRVANDLLHMYAVAIKKLEQKQIEYKKYYEKLQALLDSSSVFAPTKLINLIHKIQRFELSILN